jgi:hypothetical protein
MAEPSTPRDQGAHAPRSPDQGADAPPAPAERPDDLHIVLFGMPAAGKSSLLGALAEAARAQEHLLNGRLNDRTHGLDELRHRLYDESPRRTADEVVPYPIDFEPYTRDGHAPAADHLGAVMIDCDGRVANDLLVRRRALDEDSPEGTLAREVLDADTLVLVLDAAAPPAQVEADFLEFDRFLRQMQATRGRRAEVGGLPVFLVLTKCDLLAQPGDTAAAWMERIEQRKREVDARFRDFLARRAREAGPLPFGQLDLHVWATAVKRPALAGSPPRPREPYGVAELFRQCLEQAAAFRERRLRSGRRLVWMAGGAGGLAALLVSLTAWMLFQHNTVPTRLESTVQAFRFSDSTSAAERLGGPVGVLRNRRDRLAEIRNDPDFGKLPAEQQQLIRDRLQELDSYLDYYQKLRQLPPKADVRTEQALQDVRDRLENELALPGPEWARTEAGRLRRERLDEVEALGRAVTRARNWYLDSIDAADKLWTFAGYQTEPGAAGINWRAWSAEAEKLLDPSRAPPAEEAAVRDFDTVARARAEWERTKPRLRRLLSVCSALGLAPPGKDNSRPPVLVIPEGVTLAQARSRLTTLREAYPDYEKSFTIDGLPDAVVPAVRQAAHTSYDYLLKPGRAAVLDHLRQAGTGPEETQARWDAVRDWLRDPEELASWRALATVLARLQERDAQDPVTALAAFLQRREFTITLERVTVEIPDSLKVRPAPNARFEIYHGSADRPALVFELGDSGFDARQRLMTYSFRRVEGKPVRYRVGDSFWAMLPLRNDQRFTWIRVHSTLYQFECLRRSPRLHRNNEEYRAGTLEEGVRLTLSPPDGVPEVPDLLPVVLLP